MNKVEYDRLCQDEFAKREAQYNNEVSIAESKAATYFDSHMAAYYDERCEQELDKIDNEIDPDTLEPLPEDIKRERKRAIIEHWNKEKAAGRKEYIEASKASIDLPMSLEAIQKMFSFLLDIENADEPEIPISTSIYENFYELKDGSIYSVTEAKLIQTRTVPKGAWVLKVPGKGDEETLRRSILEFYKDNGYPEIRIGADLLTLDEYKSEVIKEINKEVGELITGGFNYAIQGQRSSITFHFSFKEDDQVNFANMATVASLMVNNGNNETIKWQGWQVNGDSISSSPTELEFTPAFFLDFYVKGALSHLNESLDIGREYKARVRAATTKEQIKDIGAAYLARIK